MCKDINTPDRNAEAADRSADTSPGPTITTATNAEADTNSYPDRNTQTADRWPDATTGPTITNTGTSSRNAHPRNLPIVAKRG